MKFDGRDRLEEAQLEMVRTNLRRQSDAELAKTYEIYRKACILHEGRAAAPSRVQYFVQAWREMRRRGL